MPKAAASQREKGNLFAPICCVHTGDQGRLPKVTQVHRQGHQAPCGADRRGLCVPLAQEPRVLCAGKPDATSNQCKCAEQVAACCQSLRKALCRLIVHLLCLAGGSRKAGAPGHEHREDDTQWQVPSNSWLPRRACTARQVQGMAPSTPCDRRLSAYDGYASPCMCRGPVMTLQFSLQPEAVRC